MVCYVGRPLSVTVTGAVHTSCVAAQIRSCLQHSTQRVPYKPIHHAFNSTDDRLYTRDCLFQTADTASSQHQQYFQQRLLYGASPHLLVRHSMTRLSDQQTFLANVRYFTPRIAEINNNNNNHGPSRAKNQISIDLRTLVFSFK